MSTPEEKHGVTPFVLAHRSPDSCFGRAAKGAHISSEKVWVFLPVYCDSCFEEPLTGRINDETARKGVGLSSGVSRLIFSKNR